MNNDKTPLEKEEEWMRDRDMEARYLRHVKRMETDPDYRWAYEWSQSIRRAGGLVLPDNWIDQPEDDQEAE